MNPRSILLTVSLLFIFAMAGCKTLKNDEPVAAIPVLNTAQEQFEYANQQAEARQLSLISDKKRFERQREIVRQHYEKVVEYFPEDRRFTPIAKAQLIEMQACIDFYPRIKASKSELRESIDAFRELMEQYPEIPVIQAKCMFDTGVCLVQLHQYAEGQAAFKYVWDNFGQSENPQLRQIGRIAFENFRITYTQE